MICVCGYAHEDYKGQAEQSEYFVGKRIGEEEFIRISGTFLVREMYYPSREVSLYACPECNTVQLRD